MSIITKLTDNDLYKFTQMQSVYHQFPATEVEYEFINRTKNVKIGFLKSKVIDEIKSYCNLKFEDYELEYLRSIPFLKDDFVDMLEMYRPNKKHINVSEKNGELKIKIKGPWWQTILFEVPILAIIEELYMQHQYEAKNNLETINKSVEYSERGLELLLDNVGKLTDYEFLNNFKTAPIRFADFGTRRRFSYRHQRDAIKKLKDLYPGNFIGTSNVYFAFSNKITPIGTMAHEWFMGQQSLYRLIDHQKEALQNWVNEYRGDLGIALTDTISLDAFLKDFDKYFAKLYDGLRHDSGSPYIFMDKVINHYKSLGIDPATKTLIFSDGLNFEDMIDIFEYNNNRTKVSFGIGTNLTNNIPELNRLNIVIKLTKSNGKPVAKISDEPNKAICNDSNYLNYLKSQFLINK